MTFCKIQDGHLAEVYTLWVLFSLIDIPSCLENVFVSCRSLDPHRSPRLPVPTIAPNYGPSYIIHTSMPGADCPICHCVMAQRSLRLTRLAPEHGTWA